MNAMAERQRNAVLGAAVADAAAMGFHWLYDQARIRAIAPESPEFRTPDSADYAGVMGYFAHGQRQSGQCSQYGEQMLTLLRSLAENEGHYDEAHYQSGFAKHFGYGGAYVGYIDHPTRDSLNNITQAEQNAVLVAESLPFEADDGIKRKLITKVLAEMKQASSDALMQRIEESVRRTDNDDTLVAHALTVAKTLAASTGPSGADDSQLPALSKLPPLVARYWDSSELSTLVDSAVRVTNNNDLAVAFAQAASELIRVAIESGDIEQVLNAAQSFSHPSVAPLALDAIQHKEERCTEATARYGMACQLEQGFPSVVHNLSRQQTFADSVKQNIYAGGDSCGRAIVLGAVLGACSGRGGEEGIPENWLQQLSATSEIEQCLNAIIR